MKFNKLLAVGATILFSAGALAGCGGSSSAKAPADTVRVMSKDVIATMDTSTNTDTIGSQAASNTMEGLYRYEGKDIKPGIATKVVKPSADGLTYTFPLRKTSWSNGDPVTANDFVYAWRRTVDPKTKSQYAYIYEGIANAKEISEGKKPVDSLGVKAIDKHTLQVTLDQPIPYFNELLTSSFYFPQNQKTVDKWGKKYGTNSKTLVFNGPYKLINWNGPDNTWTEVKNDKYWNAKNVKVKKLQYQVVKDPSTALNLYQSNKLDDIVISGDTAKQMRGSKGFNSRQMNSTFYIEMNQKKQPVFKNEKIRQAIALSIDRPQLTKQILGDGSTPANSVTPKDMSFDPSNKSKDFVDETSASGNKYTKYDPKKAKKLWKQGLAETGNNGKKFNFVLLSDDTDAAKKQSEFLQNQLEKLPGMKVTLSNVPFKTRLSRSTSGDFDMVVTAWNADFPDPINFLTLLTSNASYNRGGWSNSQFDSLVDKSMGADANNPQARWQDMKDAQNILNDQQGVVPLYQLGEAHMTQTRVKNLEISPNGSYNMVSLRIHNK
ncbi:peptide ABC transporter substrate-binding protein [Bombilactobacillus thymidiniphilus]|uniref:Peptide ABC transporter substrate-binding protein n=1 Tax=Bombilactobacillus thymidiniphilus TaxID=2923363 RepID=A0ABY4PEF8_9LACO|nr:peptide ABC transporter substrate-binding protein [Bombilactobacillus thymidiniphilus]UQS84110.1 peptide ABC transporter substrate-binding protein [Bombilactobacillus thymidiniphilus]